MNKLKLGIALSDKLHEEALAKQIAKNYRLVEMFVGENQEKTDYCITDKDVENPMPVSELMERIILGCGGKSGFHAGANNNLFTGFTAGCGGCGVTSAAKLYLRVLEMSGRSGVLVSFNAYDNGKRNSLTDLNLEELADFLGELAGREDVDEIILDVPCGFKYRKEVLNMCERQIVVYSWQDSRKAYSDAALAELKLISELVPEPGSIYEFKPLKDEESFIGKEPDLLGQLGCEVREFAEKLGV